MIGKIKQYIITGKLEQNYLIGRMKQSIIIGKILWLKTVLIEWVLTTGIYDNSKYWKNDAIYKNNP